MRRFALLAAAVILAAPPLAAIGLGQGDSYPALRALSGPLRITWTIDPVTVRELAGGRGFADDVALAVSKRLRRAGVPVEDGSFNPLAVPFVSIDLWARGVTRSKDVTDPMRVFNFQLQVFAPDSLLKGRDRRGRVEVWQRGVYGVCGTGDLRRQENSFLALCEAFAADWKAARARAAPAGVPVTAR